MVNARLQRRQRPALLLAGPAALLLALLLAGCSVDVPAAEIQATVASSEPAQAVEEAAGSAVATTEAAAQAAVDAAQAGLEGAVEGAVEGAQEGAAAGVAASQALTPTTEAVAPAAETPTPGSAAPAAAARTYTADPARSEVRFVVDEVLLGRDNRVVGSSSAVSATVTVDPAAPTEAQVGPVQVDARSLQTDDSFRDRAVRSQILQSGRDEFQYVTFTPTAVEGIPQQVMVGEPFDFTIAGDLQIRDVSAPVTFAATATPLSQDEIELHASATVQRETFDLNIPRVPGVARVSDDVTLELDLVLVVE